MLYNFDHRNALVHNHFENSQIDLCWKFKHSREILTYVAFCIAGWVGVIQDGCTPRANLMGLMHKMMKPDVTLLFEYLR